MSETPRGWSKVKVADIFESCGGGTPHRGTSRYWNGKIPWLSSGDIKADRIETASEFITRAGLDNSTSRLCRPGSVVIVVRSGILKHTLPVAVLAKEAAINQDLKCFDSKNDLLNHWFLLALKARAREILIQNREGTTVQSVKYDTLLNLEITVPPESEQRRIISKVEELLGRVDACQKHLERIPLILKRFRQAVLAAACSGRLTEDWRKKRPSKIPAIPGVEVRESLDIELPSSWIEANLGALLSGLKYGTARRCDYSKKGSPVLRIPNVQNGAVDCADLKYAILPKSELRELALDPGDLLMVRSNGSVSLVGRVAQVGDAQKGYAYAGYLMRLRPNRDFINQRYLALTLRLPSTRMQIEIPARSTSGVHNINSGEVRALVLPLPPMDEQIEIVRRVDSLFKFADQIEARYTTAKVSVDQLTQSILAKAFRGELVPQDPMDEPASRLLERIQGKGPRSLETVRA